MNTIADVHIDIGLLPLVIIALVGVIIVARMIGATMRGPANSPGKFGFLRALFVTGVLVVGFFGLFTIMLAPRLERHVEERSQVRALAVSSAVDERVSDVVEETSLEQASQSQNLVSTQDGEMLVLPLSQQSLTELLGPEAVETLDHLNGSVKPELRQAYAMIPIALLTGLAASDSTPGSTSVAPVLRSTFSEAGMNLIQEAIGSYASSESEDSTEVAESDFEPPKWLEDPGYGRVVIESDFLETDVSPEDALAPAMYAAMEDHISSVAAEKFGITGGVADIIELDIRPSAITDCIVDSTNRIEPIPVKDEFVPMQKTYALVEFPETLDKTIEANVKESVQRNRVTTLAATIGSLWLGTLVLSFLFRSGQSGSTFKKLAFIPACLVLAVPCGVMFVALSGAIVRGETVDFSWTKDKVVCVVDRLN